jgi:biotin carboxyl carrier protein
VEAAVKQKLRVGDAVVEAVSSPPGPDVTLRIAVDGNAAEFEVVATSPGSHSVRIDGRLVTLRTATAREGTWVWCEGRAWRVADASEEARRARGRGPAGLGGVTPPMPGVVVRVLVEAGDRVAKGQALVVVSAMKMEMSLVAAYGGTVKAIRATVGANVKPGDVLVDVEREGEGEG